MEISLILACLKKEIALYKKIKNNTCKKYKITPTAFDIIMFLNENPEVKTANELCRNLGIKPTMASYDIEKLINSNYVVSSPDINDKRKNIISLKDDSKPIIDEGIVLQRIYKEKLFENISDDEKENFYKILEKMTYSVDKCKIKDLEF